MPQSRKDNDVLFSLKSAKMFQHPESPQIPDVIKEDVTKEDLLILLQELDRRCGQLWDKVTFERAHGLVDYDPLIKANQAPNATTHA